MGFHYIAELYSYVLYLISHPPTVYDKTQLLSMLEDFSVKSDYHIHSNFSGDGQYSIPEIIAFLRSEGIRRAAIADHDCIEGVELAVQAASSYDIEIIPAVELSTEHNHQFIHVLGYDFQIKDEEDNKLYRALKNIEQKRMDNTPIIISKMRQAGIEVDEADIKRKVGVRAPMVTTFAQAALEDSRNREVNLLSPYRPGMSRAGNAAINFVCDNMLYGKPLYTEEFSLTVSDGVEAITDGGGIPVLAHPGIWFTDQDRPLLQKLIEKGLRGLEVYTPYHTPEQTRYFERLAKEYHLISTHGSDFHGEKVKPFNKLGKFDIKKLE